MRSFIGLGANLGDRLAALHRAVVALAQIGRVSARSHVYESAPVGGPPQPPYLNAAVALDSTLDPDALIAALHRIEAEAGRDRAREQRWGPRPLDLDVLLVGERGERMIATPALTVPHPRLAERAFALAPLVELDPTLIHPIANLSLAKLLDQARASGQQLGPPGEAL